MRAARHCHTRRADPARREAIQAGTDWGMLERKPRTSVPDSVSGPLSLGCERSVFLVSNEPLDPFAGDPEDPAAELAQLDSAEDLELLEPLSLREREEILAELGDLDVFRTLLEPRGYRGLVVDCEGCAEPHYFDWDLLAGNLRHLLDEGRTRVHEPAFAPDPACYVSWEYARGFADGVYEASAASEADTR